MPIFHLIGEHPFAAFVLLNILFIDFGQFIAFCRKGYGQIVTIAGYYGDRVLVFMILIIGSVLAKNHAEYEIDLEMQMVIVVYVYLISVWIATSFLPMPGLEDVYHHFVVLPAYALIIVGGVFKAWSYASAVERLGMTSCFGLWLVFLLLDIKLGRLDQKKFMANLGMTKF